MLKRFFVFFLSALMLFSVSGCGNQHNDDTLSSAADNSGENEISTGKEQQALVAYFSRAGENYGVGVVEQGNTEIIAEMIAEEVGADLFHIQTVNPYPENYDECTEVAQQEKAENARPELTDTVDNFEDYDVIYLGYPNWWGDMPMAVYTFLESYDFTDKIIRPFCTHAGSGLSGTVESIKTICEDSEVLDGFSIAGTTAQNDRDSAKQEVLEWLGE